MVQKGSYLACLARNALGPLLTAIFIWNAVEVGKQLDNCPNPKDVYTRCGFLGRMTKGILNDFDLAYVDRPPAPFENASHPDRTGTKPFLPLRLL